MPTVTGAVEDGEARVGLFRLDLVKGRLWRDGEEVRLGVRPAGILRVLAEANGKLVTKDEIMAAVWPSLIVDDNLLQVHMSGLRKAIDQLRDGDRPIILTVPGRGYRLVASIEKESASAAEIAVAAMLDPGSRPTLRLPNRPSIAVLPFQNMSGDPEQDYFADGVVEEITTALCRVRWFFVIARNSAFTYKGQAVDIRQVGRELGVRYVLEGSVRKAGRRVRLTGQLIEAESNHHIWADRFDGDLTDVFVLQDQITESVVGAVEPGLRDAEIARVVAKPTNNSDAYELYLRSWPGYYQFTRDSLTAAMKLCDQAIAIDPNFEAALSMGAMIRMALHSQSWAGAELYDEGLRFAREVASASQDPTCLARAGAALSYRASNPHDLDLGVTALNRALHLNPNSAEAHRFRGFAALFNGEPERTLDHTDRAFRLSPFDRAIGFAMHWRSIAYLMLDRPAEALEAAQHALKIFPSYISALRFEIAALVRLGRIEEARAAAAMVKRLAPDANLAELRRKSPYDRAPGFQDKLESAWRIAGLPE